MAEKSMPESRVDPGGPRTSEPSPGSAREDQGPLRGCEAPRERKKPRREKLDPSQLPVPPPDPETNVFDEAFTRHKAQVEAEALRKEGEFLDYLMDLPSPPGVEVPPCLSRSTSTFAASLGRAEDAFDHLDRLYSLMEQVLNLRDRNSKLCRRIRELERLRALKSAHLDLERAALAGEELVLPEEDAAFAECLLAAMLATAPEPTPKRNLRPPLPRQRSRSLAVDLPGSFSPGDVGRFSRRSTPGNGGNKRAVGLGRPPKVSKWTKVKAAFKWERAYTGGDHVENDVSRFLRVPENNDGSVVSGSSPRTAEMSAPPTPGTLSSSSSTEDIFHGSNKSTSNNSGQLSPRSREDGRDEEPGRRSRSLGGDASIPHSIAFFASTSKDVGRPRIQITGERSPAPASPRKPSGQENEVVDLATRRLTPTLTITVPSNEELRCTSSPESVSPLLTLLLDSGEERSPSEEFDSPKRPPTTSQNESSQFSVTRSRTCQEVPSEFRRQRSVKAESQTSSPKTQRHDSKWNKVKKAFLTNAASIPSSPNRISSFFDESDGLASYNASAEDLENDLASSAIQAEIQRNYQLLHEKLSAEFYRKLAEWDKLKSGSPASSPQPLVQETRDSRGGNPSRSSAGLRMLGEEQLTPEFKKKLREWKRIKKGECSPTSCEQQAARKRITDWQLWRPPKVDSKSEEYAKTHLSEDFIKKMEEWKRIKASRWEDQESSCRDPGKTGKTWKNVEDKDFRVLERELGKIEREHQKIERQREKFLDREARLSKLRRVVSSSPQKKEILVHTSTGFYRFEGISRKFTKKLYEWEKSQGISPESSTFRLLHPATRCPLGLTTVNASYESGVRQMLKRSKSVGSVVEGSVREETPIRQPSSLSLNDVENLETECIVDDSQMGSEPVITEEETTEDIAVDDSEPEAMIVDIEDVIEETASPMAELRPRQTPIYCVAASETTSIAVPLGTVTASHEPSPVILVQAGEVRPVSSRPKGPKQGSPLQGTRAPPERASTSKDSLEGDASTPEEAPRSIDVQTEHENRTAGGDQNGGSGAIGRPEEGPSEGGQRERDLAEVKRIIQDFCKASGGALRGQGDVLEGEVGGPGDCRYSGNLLGAEIQREDSCRTNDGTRDGTSDPEEQNSGRSPMSSNGTNKRIHSAENLPNGEYRGTGTGQSPQFKEKVPRTEGNLKGTNAENCKKRTAVFNEKGIARRTTSCGKDGISRMRFEDPLGPMIGAEEDDVVITVDRDIRQKRVLKTRRLTDTQVGYKWCAKEVGNEDNIQESCRNDALTVSAFSDNPSVEKIVINESTLNRIVVRTANTETRSSQDQTRTNAGTSGTNAFSTFQDSSSKKERNGATRNVFVKTKRMIFSPFRRDSKGRTPETQGNEVEEEASSGQMLQSGARTCEERSRSNSEFLGDPRRKKMDLDPENGKVDLGIRKMDLDPRRPPIPQSPVPARKEYRKSSPKTTPAPSIRMMIQRYNQKLEDAGSPGSSGSGSPIWRSPASERRVRTRTERYQEEVRRAIEGHPRNKEVFKSASAGIIGNVGGSSGWMETPAKREILKSTSANFGAISSSSSLFSSRINVPVEDALDISATSRRSPSAGTEKKHLEDQPPEGFSQSILPRVPTMEVPSSTIPMGNRGNGGTRSVVSSRSSMSHLDAEEAVQEEGERSSSRTRAMRIRRAKQDFLSRGPGCYSHDPQMHREDAEGTSKLEEQDEAPRSDLFKSASAGMINVDQDTFERLNLNRGYESLPRAPKTGELTSRLGQIASRFRRSRLKRSKDKERDGRMSAVSMLCRQSLLVDIRDQTTKSCPSTPAFQREEEDEKERLGKHRVSH
ncbi:uncharacterized protein LOC105701841 isoform X2 [Orussus abietinus]|uniref:uncharacterized protein LOC105701841 isoform X2 n=1 Tax=Orussus abietinus TaxID=222816 RepID=UPI000626C308|nr:uncharacterized protein LOC105701841 isoform X2 [Orussus abietinus]